MSLCIASLCLGCFSKNLSTISSQHFRSVVLCHVIRVVGILTFLPNNASTVASKLILVGCLVSSVRWPAKSPSNRSGFVLLRSDEAYAAAAFPRP